MKESKKENKRISASVSAREEKYNFIAKKSKIKRALHSQQPFIVLMYKEVYLCTNDLADSLPSNIVHLLQEYENVFPKETPY